MRDDIRPVMAHFKPVWIAFEPKRADFRHERTDFRSDRSPKGIMWSAIPVALLCMVVNWNERKQGSSPEGDEVL